jgi:hypothetical protein
MKNESITDIRLKAILIAFETQRKNLESTGFRIKSISEELEPIVEIANDDVFNVVESLLNEYDVLKVKFEEYSRDLDDFIRLLNHEMDQIIEPLNIAIKHVEKLQKDYRQNIKLLNIEISKRYK